MKKFICVLFAAVFTFGAFSAAANGEYSDYLEVPLYSECAMLICTDNDEVIFSKNINKQTMPASLTKVITASVILSECEDLDEMFTVPESCLTELQGTGSSLAGLKAGESVSIHDLLCCLLIHSGNDAATALACWSTGSDRQAFIDKMNALAESLGCVNSHFTNVHGLDDEDQYVTCADMAVFFENAFKYETFAEICGMTSYTLPESNMQKERTIRTTNFTLMPGYKDYYCKYEQGGKTGTTSGAGCCLVSKASNNGYNYIAVCMNSIKEDIDNDYVDENGAFVDTKAMYDWAFGNLRLVPIASSARIVGEVPVRYGKDADRVTLCPGSNSYGLMPKGVDESGLLIEVIDDTAPERLTAPVHKGDYVCKGRVLFSGDVIAEIDLVSSSDIKRSFLSLFGTTIEDIFSSPVFKALVAAAAVVFLLLVFSRRAAKKKSRPKSNYETLKQSDFAKKGERKK